MNQLVVVASSSIVLGTHENPWHASRAERGPGPSTESRIPLLTSKENMPCRGPRSESTQC